MSDHQLFRVVVAAYIYDSNGKFLMAKRHPKDDNLPDFWAVPAGHVEIEGPMGKGIPEAFEDNLKREVMEEIGVEIVIKQYLDSHFWVEEDYKKITIAFLCGIKSGDPVALEDTAEISWKTFEEIKDLNLAPEVLRVITKAQAMLTWQPRRRN